MSGVKNQNQDQKEVVIELDGPCKIKGHMQQEFEFLNPEIENTE